VSEVKEQCRKYRKRMSDGSLNVFEKIALDFSSVPSLYFPQF
jgi:hypothetical protein